VAYLSITPGTDLADKTRNIVKAVMSDQVQMSFNYEGLGTKDKSSLKKKFPALLSVIYRK